MTAPTYLRANEQAAWRAGYRAAPDAVNPYTARTRPQDRWKVNDLRSAWELGRKRAAAERKVAT